MSEYEEYKNKETKEIEDLLNKARRKLIEDGLPPECLPYKADVRFIRKKENNKK